MAIFANFIHHRFIMAHFVQEAFILIMVLLFLSKLRSFLGLWQFVSLCLRGGEIHSRWRWIFLRRICLCLVWRLSRGSLGFLESSYIKGIPTADWFGQKRHAVSWLSGRRGSARSIIVGWGFRSSPSEMRWFFLRALRFFVHLNTAWFHGLHWMDWWHILQ